MMVLNNIFNIKNTQISHCDNHSVQILQEHNRGL